MKYSNQTVKINNTNCKQISKQAARKLFTEGKEIFLHPSNMVLNNMWMSPCPIKLDELDLQSKIDFAHYCVQNNFPFSYTPDVTPELQFDSIVSNYESYNCIDELGKYANFFTSI